MLACSSYGLDMLPPSCASLFSLGYWICCALLVLARFSFPRVLDMLPHFVIAPEGGTIYKTQGGIETSAGRGQPIQDPGKEQRIQEPREKRTGIAQEGGKLSKSLGRSRRSTG